MTSSLRSRCNFGDHFEQLARVEGLDDPARCAGGFTLLLLGRLTLGGQHQHGGVFGGRPGAYERPSVDPDLKPFRTREYSASVDYSISKDLVLSAHFTRKEIDYAVEDIGGLDPKGNEVFTIGNPGFGFAGFRAVWANIGSM